MFSSFLPVPAFADYGDTLPLPQPPFKGKIGNTYKESLPDFPKPIQAPDKAPNVLLVLLDDVGFAQTSTFGGLIETPNLDRLAASGLRYNQFHTTALCSPTRAALLTGRNHHSVNTGVITELATGFLAIPRFFPAVQQRSPKYYAAMVIIPPLLENGTIPPPTKPARWVPSIAGRLIWDLITSMDS